MRGSSSAVGQRFPARAVVLACTSMPASRRSWTRRDAVVVLPAVPVTPIVGTARTFEHEVAEAADTSARRAEPRDARRHLRRPDVEERLVVLTRRRGRGRRARGRRRRGARSASASAVAAPEPASVTARPSPASSRASATASASNPSTRVTSDAKARRPGRRRSPAPADFRGLCTCTGTRSTVDRQHVGSQRVCGNPRSTLLVDGSGQRDVTTFPRV